MNICGWGRYPVAEAEVFEPATRAEWISGVKGNTSIARGLGRSYGDSACSPTIYKTTRFDHYMDFDATNGVLVCEAGVSIDEILKLIVPFGWFMPVTPGTSYVTVGGAIASDVHGKNHHISGTFSQHVRSIELLLGTGEIVDVSRVCYPELFRATCGGMGLTGVILSAAIALKRIQSSTIEQTTIKSGCIEEVVEQFEANSASTYSVAWIDCLAKGRKLGRSLLMLGEHAADGEFVVARGGSFNVPMNMPSQLLNTYSIKLFNELYYSKTAGTVEKKNVAYKPFFYPLDSLRNWNRLYGKRGFIQYQFVLPKAAGLIALKDVLTRIADSGKGSFLAVLKAFGAANQNYLSFPMEGYTLALDFKVSPAVFELARKLDDVILGYGGRLYLTKDALMSEKTFKAGYPSWSEFEEVRSRYGAIGKFSSFQSMRLGLL